MVAKGDRYGERGKVLGTSLVYVHRMGDSVELTVVDEDSGRGPTVMLEADEWRKLVVGDDEMRQLLEAQP